MKYVIVSAILLSIFAVLAFSISGDNSITQWDSATFHKLNKSQGDIIDKMMVGLTKYGREAVWIGVILALAVFGRKEGRKTAIVLTVAFLILIPLGTILKNDIDRPRPLPDNLIVKPDKDASFPSGHATIVSAGAAVLLFRLNKGKQLAFSMILAIEAILVSYSRIYVGAHYPLDVVGGILLGTGIACIAVYISNRFLQRAFSYVDNMKK